MKKSSFIVLVFCIFALVGFGFSDEEQKPVTVADETTKILDVFKKLDADENGFLSKEEVANDEDLAKAYETLDENKDNLLDMNEFYLFQNKQ